MVGKHKLVRLVCFDVGVNNRHNTHLEMYPSYGTQDIAFLMQIPIDRVYVINVWNKYEMLKVVKVTHQPYDN